MDKILKLSIKESENINRIIHSVYNELDNGGAYQSAEIIIDGCFRITEPITFRENCTFPITIMGSEKGAVIDGGWHIPEWKNTLVNGLEAWTAKVDREHAKYLCFDQLFVNGQRRYRPVYPSDCFMGLTGVTFDGEKTQYMDLTQAEKYWCTSNSAFSYDGNLPRFSHIEDLTLNLNHCWLHERLPVDEIDYENHIIYTKSMSLFCAFDNEKIYLENVFEEFKQSGQWYYNKSDQMIYYIPMDGEIMEAADIVIPQADELVHLEKVSNKHIKNIKFQYASSRSDYHKMISERSKVYSCNTNRQAECEIPGVIQMIASQYCSVSNCTMAHMGRYAIELAKASNHITIEKNTFFDMGTGAFKNHRDDADDLYCKQDETSFVQITDNHIYDYGRLFKAAVAILATDVHHYIISHNEIHHGEYSAISCGWVWGYQMANIGHNQIEYNYLHHIGNYSVCDMGAIYMLGVQPCTTIKNNLIHDVLDRENNGWGIYLDEGSSCMTVENNIIYRVSTDCMRIHYGKDNRVVNNVFAYGARSQLGDGKYTPYLEMMMERNIFYADHSRMVFIRRGEGEMEFDKNIYYSESGEVGFCHNSYEKDLVYVSFEDWKQMGYDRFGMVADPLFVDAKNGNFTLKEHSPAYEVGFKNIDMNTVGLRK